MQRPEIREESDEVLRPFLLATGAVEAESSLVQIISDHAETVFKGIIKAKLRASLGEQDGDHLNQDALEISSSVKETLLSELQSLRNDPRKTIKDFQSYVAVITFNACHDYLRRKYPQRHSLKNKLRYLLTHRTDFALWESDDGNLPCGETGRRGERRDRDSSGRLQALALGEDALIAQTFNGCVKQHAERNTVVAPKPLAPGRESLRATLTQKRASILPIMLAVVTVR